MRRRADIRPSCDRPGSADRCAAFRAPSHGRRRAAPLPGRRAGRRSPRRSPSTSSSRSSPSPCSPSRCSGSCPAGGANVARDLPGQLGLSGSAARLVHNAVDRRNAAGDVATVVGLVGLAWTGTTWRSSSATRTTRPWDVDRRGLVDRLYGLAWLGGAAVLHRRRGARDRGVGAAPRRVRTARDRRCRSRTDTALFVWTSWILPNRRVPIRALLPPPALGAVGLEALKVIGAYVVPHLVSHASAVYGAIGVVVRAARRGCSCSDGSSCTSRSPRRAAGSDTTANGSSTSRARRCPHGLRRVRAEGAAASSPRRRARSGAGRGGGRRGAARTRSTSGSRGSRPRTVGAGTSLAGEPVGGGRRGAPRARPGRRSARSGATPTRCAGSPGPVAPVVDATPRLEARHRADGPDLPAQRRPVPHERGAGVGREVAGPSRCRSS